MADQTDQPRSGTVAQGNAYSAARAAAAALRPRLAESPRVAIVLGTGLGGLAEDIASAQRIAYADIPGFPQSTVQGHAGQLVLGRFAGVPVAALQGRFHLYEGYTPGQVVLPVRVLGLLGARILIVTNAAGGLRSSFQAGDLMLIRDHIGIPNLAGMNPLVGPNDEQMGTRFPAMTHAYDAQLREHAHVAAGEQRIVLHEGIYVMVSGPTFETPAELRYLRGMGGDAVGMSTVPEVVAAVHMGLRVLAISCITNVALPDAPHAPDEAAVVPEPSHAEVIATAQSAGVRLATLIAAILARIARDVA